MTLRDAITNLKAAIEQVEMAMGESPEPEPEETDEEAMPQVGKASRGANYEAERQKVRNAMAGEEDE